MKNENCILQEQYKNKEKLYIDDIQRAAYSKLTDSLMRCRIMATKQKQKQNTQTLATSQQKECPAILILIQFPFFLKKSKFIGSCLVKRQKTKENINLMKDWQQKQTLKV